MLSIKGYGDRHYKEWHVGEPFPTFHGAGVEIMVDGHELQWLMGAMKAGSGAATTQYYKEVWGVCPPGMKSVQEKGSSKEERT